MTTNKALNQGLASGDYESYKALFERCYGRLLSFVFSLIKDRQAAEDIVQEQFMKLWDCRKTIGECISVESYLYVMTKNSTINYMKSHNKTVAISNDLPADISYADYDKRIDLSLMKSRLMEVVGMMPPQRRKVFTMCKIDGLSNTEVAKRLGLSVKTVDRHLAIAKSFIKENIPNTIS